MTSRLTCLAAIAAAGLAAPVAARAAAPWTPPEVVTTQPSRAPQLAFGTGSTGVATVGFGAAVTRIAPLPVGSAAPVGPRTVGTVQDGPLPYAATRTLSLRRRPTDAADRFTLGYSFGRTDGAVGAFRTLRTVRLRPNEAELAVSPNGNAIIAFAEDRGGATRLWLATRRAGASRFATARVVRGSGSARSVAVSVNDRGTWVLAYALSSSKDRAVEARIGTTAGRTGAVQKLGDEIGVAALAAVVAPSGRTTVAWTTHDGGEEQNEPTQLRTNVAPAGRSTFAGQTVLDRAAPGALATEPSPPSLAAAPDGTAIVGYTLSGTFSGDGTAAGANALTPAKVAVQGADARWDPPVLLAEDGVVGQVAARADGTFGVPYVTGVPLEGGASPLRVALGRSTFTSEAVAEDAGEDSALAFEPGAAGAPVVLYTRQRATGAAVSRRGG